MKLKKYRKRPDQFVIAVQINLETDGICYKKWGHDQSCKMGDWLVNNNGDSYTVDQATFAASYREVSPGIYLKTTPVWARVVEVSDKVSTLEGYTDYKPGDYWVANNEDGTDAYAVPKTRFEEMYELLE